jgi:TolB-like protein
VIDLASARERAARQDAARKKLAAIVAIDVAGYSALSERDQDRAAAIVAELRACAERACQAHGGRIFSTAGDGAMLEFASASDALAAAIALCEYEHGAPIRLGVHLGEVNVAADGDLLGHGVNVAARLQAAAEPGAALVSQLVRDTADSALAERLTARGRIKLDKMRALMNVFAFAPSGAAPARAARVPVLAVLPFDNISKDKGTRFFSDGVTEEIHYAVSRVQGLKVIGSTSSFAFRGREKAKAARALAATHLLDGSVRRLENRVRITAELTDVESKVVLWSERYDRDLADAFTLQEEIAREVAGALALAFGAARQAKSQRVTASVFDAYLRAREHMRAGAPARVEQAAGMLAEIVRDAPDFARGWSALALAQMEIMRMSGVYRDRIAEDARESAQRAIGLDPTNGEAYVALFALESDFGRWRDREKHLERALALEPNNPRILLAHGQFLVSVGRVKAGYAQQARAFELDPLDPMLAAFHGHNVWATESKAAGRAILEEAAKRDPDNIFLWYMRLNLARVDGDYEVATALHALGPKLLPTLADSAVYKAGALFQATMQNPSPEAFMSLGEQFAEMAEEQPSAALDLAVALSALGLVGPAFAIFEESLENIEAFRANANDALRPHVGYETALLFIQPTLMLRLNPRFVRMCARFGLLRYWRESDRWPDCVEEAAPMYDFRAEAGKYV